MDGQGVEKSGAAGKDFPACFARRGEEISPQKGAKNAKGEVFQAAFSG